MAASGEGASLEGVGAAPFVVTEETVAGHRAQFYAEAAKYYEKGDHTTYPISEELHSKIFAFAKALKQGTTLKDLREQYGRGSVDKWKNTYDVLIIGSEEETLVYRPGEDENGDLPALDQHQEVLHRGNVFEKILAVHNGTDGSAAKGHRKARTLHNAVKEKYGRSVPQWATKLLGDTCPVCIMKASRKKPKAHHHQSPRQQREIRGQAIMATVTVTRIGTDDPRMSKVVVHNGVVYISGQVDFDATDIKGQTRNVLAKVDDLLARGGASKSSMLSASIWLKDISRDFRGMNEVWNEWVDPDNKPVRAAVEAKLAREQLLVEVQVTAAKE